MTTLADDEAQEGATTSTKKLKKIHAEAMCQFEEDVLPQIIVRELALQARRFINIPGAQWDGAWGDMLDNAVKAEIDKLGNGWRKIRNDYRQNRIEPDYRPDGGQSDQETADTLDGLYRADSYRYNAMQAYDNAFDEGSSGGMGAWRLANEWADPLDKDNDQQRINPGLLIADADQSVFFDANCKTYDKSDGRRGWVLTATTVDAFKDQWNEEVPASWPTGVPTTWQSYPWFRPDTVIIAEYYKVEDVDDTVAVFKHVLTDEEERLWASEISAEDSRSRVAQGWQRRNRKATRRRVHKYVLSGQGVLKDCGYIAGPNIPIVPYYGNRAYIDGVEWFIGYVQKKMDAQRTYNLQISKLAETSALAPRQLPIFHPDQMTGNLPDLWANANIDRSPYLLAGAVLNPDGTIAQMGPSGYLEPPTVGEVTATLLQLSAGDIVADTEDGADEVKANVSAEAMDIAATRVDERSGIYLDNFRLSMKRGGEIYLGMAREVYVEPGRMVDTMDDDGGDGEAELHEPFLDGDVMKVRNDFASGRYKVVADVTEATSTRKDKTVKASLNTADIATKVGNTTLANAALLTAVMNQDGEGMQDFQRFARRQALEMGLVEPNEDEKQKMQEAAQNAQPDPNQLLTEAQVKSLAASAGKDEATAQKAVADTKLSEAKTIETLANAQKIAGESGNTADLPEPANDVENTERLARARLHDAQAENIMAEIPLKRIRTGLELQQAEHAQRMSERQQDHAERTVKEE